MAGEYQRQPEGDEPLEGVGGRNLAEQPGIGTPPEDEMPQGLDAGNEALTGIVLYDELPFLRGVVRGLVEETHYSSPVPVSEFKFPQGEVVEDSFPDLKVMPHAETTSGTEHTHQSPMSGFAYEQLRARRMEHSRHQTFNATVEDAKGVESERPSFLGAEKYSNNPPLDGVVTLTFAQALEMGLLSPISPEAGSDSEE